MNPNGESNRIPSAIPPPAPPTTEVVAAPVVPAAVAAAVAAAATPAPAVVDTPINPSGTHRLWIGGRSSPSSVVRTRNAGGGRLAPVGLGLVVGESDETDTGADTRD